MSTDGETRAAPGSGAPEGAALGGDTAGGAAEASPGLSPLAGESDGGDEPFGPASTDATAHDLPEPAGPPSVTATGGLRSLADPPGPQPSSGGAAWEGVRTEADEQRVLAARLREHAREQRDLEDALDTLEHELHLDVEPTRGPSEPDTGDPDEDPPGGDRAGAGR